MTPIEAHALLVFVAAMEHPLEHINGFERRLLVGPDGGVVGLARGANAILLDDAWLRTGRRDWEHEDCGTPIRTRWQVMVMQSDGNIAKATVTPLAPAQDGGTFVLCEGRPFALSQKTLMWRTYVDDDGQPPPFWVWHPGSGVPVIELADHLMIASRPKMLPAAIRQAANLVDRGQRTEAIDVLEKSLVELRGGAA